MKKIIVLIVIFAIIVILLASILFIKKNNYKLENEKNMILSPEDKKGYEIVSDSQVEATPSAGGTAYDGDNILKYLTVQTEYYNIKNIIENYFYECSNLKNVQVMVPRTGLSQADLEKYIAEQENEMKELAQNVLYSMLSKQYINEFNLSKTNLPNKFGIDYSYKIVLDNIMSAAQDDKITAYFVEGSIINITQNKNREFKIIIVTDSTNFTFNIYPEEYLKKHSLYNLKNEDKLKINIKKIDEDKHNKYEIPDVTNETICKSYFEDLKNRMLYLQDTIYNIIDKDYFKQKFGKKENISEYLNDNKNTISSSQLKEYKVAPIGNLIKCICIDNYNNYYILNINKETFKYTILLDDYTVMEGSEIISYSRLNQTNKAQYNLVKFIKMINHKDYNAIYNILNSEFRNSNFKSVNDLKRYIINNFYSINNIKLEKMEEKDNYYIFKCKISNYNNSKENKNINIIIGKTNNTNFEMSFSFE